MSTVHFTVTYTFETEDRHPKKLVETLFEDDPSHLLDFSEAQSIKVLSVDEEEVDEDESDDADGLTVHDDSDFDESHD